MLPVGYFYGSRPHLLDAVKDCQTGSHEDVFDSKLSDHLPIIASVEI